jgi:hypothetical protein
MKKLNIMFLVVLMLFKAHWIYAEPAVPLHALENMPVKEITVFKDGHALVLHNGKMPTDESGNVVMDYLPSPVIGAFWPYSSDEYAQLSAVTASQHKVLVERTTLNLRELIEANIGSQVIVTEMPVTVSGSNVAPVAYEATIVAIPTQSGEELETASPPYSGERLSQKGNMVLFDTDNGVKAVNFDRILDVTFKGDYNTVLPHEEFRNLLTLKLDWQDGQPEKEADVGIMYLQKGIRWIPNYKISIDGEGNAIVQLQATLINELADINDVTAHLVIGVPTFVFKDTLDPISLQETVAQLSQHFQPDAQTAQAFSNVLTTQMVFSQSRQQQVAPGTEHTIDLGPEVAESGKNEDLFIFTVNHITLKKGQRMVMPITEFSLNYRDVYVLDIPFTPPPEVWRNFNHSQQAEINRLFHAPKVKHKIRLSNDSEYPLTTAPALIFRDNRILAQGMSTYTAVGSESDLDITTAVDIRVKKSDTETKRTPNAVTWHNDQYGRIDLAGKITLTNFSKQPVEVEVVRHVLGNIDDVSDGGESEMVNVFEDWTYGTADRRPPWWGWFSWPYWWYHFNSIGRITWDIMLEPGQPVELNYTWYYYWR